MSERHLEKGPLEDGDEYRIVLVTAPDEEVGNMLARGLLEAGLAACVSQVSGLRSTYTWQGAIEEEEEVLVLIKTLADSLEALASWIRESHTYETPEIIALTPSEVSRAYAEWWAKSCKSPDPPPIES